MIEHITNHDDWIKSRLNGIGGSEAACLTGDNPYKSNVQLWREKCCLIVPEDISDKPCVKFGKRAESPIRELFALAYEDEYSVEYSEFDIHRNDKYPFIFATLDGILTDRNGRKGILEIKTTTIHQKFDWKKWTGRVPQNYYIQLLHQLLATGFEFAVICPFITYQSEHNGCERKMFIDKLERQGKEAELRQLLEKEITFWEYVENGKEPPMILPQI